MINKRYEAVNNLLSNLFEDDMPDSVLVIHCTTENKAEGINDDTYIVTDDDLYKSYGDVVKTVRFMDEGKQYVNSLGYDNNYMSAGDNGTRAWYFSKEKDDVENDNYADIPSENDVESDRF